MKTISSLKAKIKYQEIPQVTDDRDEIIENYEELIDELIESLENQEDIVEDLTDLCKGKGLL